MANDDIIKLLQDVLSGNQIDPLSQSLLQDIKALVDSQVEVTNRQQLEVKEIKAIFAAFRAFLKSEGINSTKLLGKLTQMQGALTKDGTIVKLDKLERALSNLLSSGVIQTQMANQRGDNSGLLNSSSMSSPLVKQIVTELSKNQKTSTLLGLNNFQRWWVSWANGYTVDQDKKRKGMVAALIDGLAANKFVGGAMQDTVKMLGLLAGSWIKNKVGGNLGGFLGASAVVLTQVIAGLVPVVLQAMFTAGFNRLFLGPLLKGASGAGGAAGGGMLASLFGLGAGQSSPVKTIPHRYTIKSPDFSAEKIENLKNQSWIDYTKKTKTGKPMGVVREGPRPLPANTKLVASINKNTAALAKNAGWLGKLINNPLIKGGGKLLGVLGKFAVPAVAGISAIGSGYAAYKDFRQGNVAGGIWNTVAGISDIATILAPGFYKLIPIAISMFASWMASRSEKKSEVDKLLGTSPGRIFWVSPQHHLAGSSNGSTPYGSTHGGRGYVSSGTGLQKLVDPKKAHVSQTGINFIKNHEGHGEKAYWDVTGFATKWGMHKIDGKNVDPKKKYTQEQFNRSFAGYISGIEKSIRSQLKPGAKVTQGMIDAMADVGYNYGSGTSHLKEITRLINIGQYEQAKNYISNLKSNPGRRKESTQALWRNPLKETPKETSQQTVTIQTPSVSSTTEEVKAPEEPKVEVKKEEQKAGINEILKMDKPTIDGKSEKKEEEKVSGGLTADIAKAILNGVDIPGNDTTFDMMTKCNMAGLLGGY